MPNLWIDEKIFPFYNFFPPTTGTDYAAASKDKYKKNLTFVKELICKNRVNSHFARIEALSLERTRGSNKSNKILQIYLV